MPNSIESLEALLATVSLGAIWSCSSPDFGSHVSIIIMISTHFMLINIINCLSVLKSVLDRFSQIKPKIIFSVTEVAYNGKIHDHKLKLTQVIEGITHESFTFT